MFLSGKGQVNSIISRLLSLLASFIGGLILAGAEYSCVKKIKLTQDLPHSHRQLNSVMLITVCPTMNIITWH